VDTQYVYMFLMELNGIHILLADLPKGQQISGFLFRILLKNNPKIWLNGGKTLVDFLSIKFCVTFHCVDRFMDIYREIIRSIRPSLLLFLVLFYALGVGLARYLGGTLQWNIVIVGFFCALSVQLFAFYIFDYFQLINQKRTLSKGVIESDPLNLASTILTRTMLVSALTGLAIATSLSILIINDISTPVPVLLIILVSILFIIGYALPPLELSSSGYGELIHSFLVSTILPTFAFLLQIGEYHRLLAMTTFPLFTFYLASLISFELSYFAHDLKLNNKNLLIRIGWQTGMALHNYLILCGFIILGISLLLGMPAMIGLPVFITLPLGMLQIWQMKRISDGIKPNWRTLNLASYFLVCIATYLFTYSYWIR
jgi:1,4-dihydroxy-2-naphthoate octaprenyltransferase